MFVTKLRVAAVLTVLGSLIAASCGAGADGDKHGLPPEPTVLRLATISADLRYYPAVVAFAEDVARRSNGRLRIEQVAEVGDFAPDGEQRLVRATAGGEFELGIVSTRVFDTLGVHAFDALSVPLLVSSYAVQARIMTSDIPAAMLAGVTPAGVTGLALLPGDLQYPIAAARPLLAADDYHGLTFNSRRSAATADAIRALGATPADLVGPFLRSAVRNGTVDGYARSMRMYADDEMAAAAPHVTTNVALWSEPMALIANPAALERLSTDERRWLTEAGAAAARTPLSSATEQDELAAACEQGAQVARASPADRASLDGALASIASSLEHDPATAGFITQIRTLAAEASSEPPPAQPPACSRPRPITPEVTNDPAAAEALAGTYRMRLSAADGKHDPHNPSGAGYPMVFTMVLHDGLSELQVTEANGTVSDEGRATYRVEGDVLQIVPGTGAPLRFRIARKGDALQLTAAGPMDPGDRFVMTYRPWHRIG